jgi:hypothetical protein
MYFELINIEKIWVPYLADKAFWIMICWDVGTSELLSGKGKFLTSIYSENISSIFKEMIVLESETTSQWNFLGNGLLGVEIQKYSAYFKNHLSFQEVLPVWRAL